MTRFVIACASHSDTILASNLERSPLLGTLPLHVERGAPSAAIAYNRALDATTAPVVVFAHHDVFLPQGWETLLAARLAELPDDWAVFGTFGIGLDDAHVGPVWSSSLGTIVGRVPVAPVPVQSFDELLIVLRRDSGLRFDEALPGWHMYGTDIVQTARKAGFGAYAGGLPCIHNDRYPGVLGADFDEAYRFMQRKWAAALPLRTPITNISRSGLHLRWDHWRNRRSAPFRLGMAVGRSSVIYSKLDRLKLELSVSFSWLGEERTHMEASKFSDAQKAFIIKQGEEGTPVAEICRKAGISQATYFNWKKKYAGLLPTEMKPLDQRQPSVTTAPPYPTMPGTARDAFASSSSLLGNRET